MQSNNKKRNKISFPFFYIPKAIILSEEWHKLPHSSQALVFNLMSQYSGGNNGRLTTAFNVMQRCGWSSKETLARAKKALIECKFIVCTRKGHAPRTAEWFAFTWWELDFHPTMDIERIKFPYKNFIQPQRIDPNNERLAPLSVVR